MANRLTFNPNPETNDLSDRETVIQDHLQKEVLIKEALQNEQEKQALLKEQIEYEQQTQQRLHEQIQV